MIWLQKEMGQAWRLLTASKLKKVRTPPCFGLWEVEGLDPGGLSQPSPSNCTNPGFHETLFLEEFYPTRGECKEGCYTQWTMVWEGSWEGDDGMVAQEVSRPQPCLSIPRKSCMSDRTTSCDASRCSVLIFAGQQLPADIGAHMDLQTLALVMGNTMSALVSPFCWSLMMTV